jgi:hypothetical protein
MFTYHYYPELSETERNGYRWLLRCSSPPSLLKPVQPTMTLQISLFFKITWWSNLGAGPNSATLPYYCTKEKKNRPRIREYNEDR